MGYLSKNQLTRHFPSFYGMKKIFFEMNHFQSCIRKISIKKITSSSLGGRQQGGVTPGRIALQLQADVLDQLQPTLVRQVPRLGPQGAHPDRLPFSRRV